MFPPLQRYLGHSMSVRVVKRVRKPRLLIGPATEFLKTVAGFQAVRTSRQKHLRKFQTPFSIFYIRRFLLVFTTSITDFVRKNSLKGGRKYPYNTIRLPPRCSGKLILLYLWSINVRAREQEFPCRGLEAKPSENMCCWMTQAGELVF